MATFAAVPPSVPCPMPVRGTFPVLVSVNTWDGSSEQARIPRMPEPGQFRAWDTVQVAGVRVALTTAATPVPVNATGEPVTGTLAVIAAVPVDAPVAVGENTTLIVQVAPAAKVVPQVPGVVVDREKGAETATATVVAVTVPEFDSVKV